MTRTPFCRLLRFKRFSDETTAWSTWKDDPTVLVVAPLSGHHSTLLRDTVQTSWLRDHKVFITDWDDARMVAKPSRGVHAGRLRRHDQDPIRRIGADNLHRDQRVCQPTVPVLAAVSLMAARGEPIAAKSMVMMGGPIDSRESPTAVNNPPRRSRCGGSSRNVIHTVPANYPGRGRQSIRGSCSTRASSR